MEENNVIICEKCFTENEATRKTCENCGAKLYINENKNEINNNQEKYEDNIEKLLYQKTQQEKSKIEYVKEKSNNSNKVAEKFTLVVIVVKIIGYICAVITAISLMSSGNDLILLGILAGIAIAITTWLSTLFLEAIAEGLNLLQNIKDKL